MKFILFVVLFSSYLYADPTCDENGNPISAITQLATPNCLNEKYLGPALENNTNELCNNCKSNFQKFVKEPIVEINKKEKQNQYLDAALKEYQKNLTENLLDAMKLRAMRPTGASLANSIKSCQMRSIDDFSKSCNSPIAMDFLKNSKTFNSFNISMKVELGKILSSDAEYYPENALLKRNKPSCFIPEKDLLYISISALEEVLTPEIIKVIGTLDPTKYESVEEMFLDEKLTSLFKDENEVSAILSSFKTHPLIADKFSTPGSTALFFKSIRDPRDVKKLRDVIYNKSNGDDYDKRLAAKCDESFNTLKSTICSSDFENGKINLNAFQNHDKLFSKPLRPTSDEFTTSAELEKKNIDVLKLCDSSPSENKLQLSSLFGKLNKSLNSNYVEQTLEKYKIDKHEKDLGQINENLCSRANQNCNDNTYACKILQKYKSIKDPKSVDYKLANSSNKEVNELLRSMIGDTSKLDSKTKDILIAQGIIPKDDGTLVKQPDIPERQPEFFAKEQNQQQQPGTTTIANAKSGAPTNVSNSAKSGRNPASDYPSNEGYSNANTKSTSNTLPDFSDLMDDQQELKGIQDEIKRRLLGLPENKPATLDDAKKIARDSFKSRGKKISPDQEDAFATRMMQQPEAPVQNIANNSQTPNSVSENRAAVSGGESANAKWRKGQDQAALMGMQGAQQVLGKDSVSNAAGTGPDAKPKDMTKVALNLADDPRVTLSDMFNKKIDQNDPETQLLKVLLRSKNNFLLQVKSMNFKIIFDEKNNFNLLLESGNQQEAARIRPQLEMFLKKLKT